MSEVVYYQARPRNRVRLESMKPTTDYERQVRRQAHAKAILKGITIREATYIALEFWVLHAPDDPRIDKHP